MTPRATHLARALAAAALMGGGGCASGGPATGSGTTTTDGAAVTTSTEVAPTATGADAGVDRPGSTAQLPRQTSSTSVNRTTSGVATSTVATLDDPVDATPPTPGYADLTGLTLTDVDGLARIEIRVDARVPTRLADGEVVGIGVDLYEPGSGGEGQEQVFLLGEQSGWSAYLTLPGRNTGPLPGRFELDGNRIVVELRWSDLTGRSDGRVGAFAEWTAPAGVTSSGGEDTVGPVAYRR